MSDLSQFGITPPAKGTTPEETQTTTVTDGPELEADDSDLALYEEGRCRAVRDGRRCEGRAEAGTDLCPAHGQQEDPTTIDDGPRALIAATTGQEWEYFDNWLIRGAIKDREWPEKYGDGDSV